MKRIKKMNLKGESIEFDNSKEWHWFKGGILVSLLSVVSYFIFEAIANRNYPFGVTAGFGYLAGKFGSLFKELATNPVIQRYATKPDAFIEFFTIIGLIAGGYTASRITGTFAPEGIPDLWKRHHGPSLWKRGLFVLVGSVLLGYGAALASGCTTGNILQGWAHLSLGSMVAGISFFAAGILTARILYPRIWGKQ